MYDVELQKRFNDYVDRITKEVNQNQEQSTDLEYGLTLYGYESTIINWAKDESFNFNIDKIYDEGDIVWYEYKYFVDDDGYIEESYFVCKLDLTVGKKPTDDTFFKRLTLS